MTYPTHSEASQNQIVPAPNRKPLSVPGMRTAAVRTGVKPSGDLDLALIDMGQSVTAAGVFTRNTLCAAPVIECRERLDRNPQAQTVVINSGNANAMTGQRGLDDTRAMLNRVEARCGGPALVLSTGIIGVPLPLDRVLSGIDQASEQLSENQGDAVARAILTTDTCTKSSTVDVYLPPEAGERARKVTVSGVAKGSGMIHPNMATMLAVIATEVPMTPVYARNMLKDAVDQSFHTITVDGDTSTNDAVILLAGGANMPMVAADSRRGRLLTRAVSMVAHQLAMSIVRDGEGASRIAHIRVEGARSVGEARRVAESVALSSLVKTALAGGDPNWGRILAAAANSGVPLTAESLNLSLSGIPVFRKGEVLPADASALDRAFSQNEVEILLQLGLGKDAAVMHTTDLTQEYVAINSEYTT